MDEENSARKSISGSSRKQSENLLPMTRIKKIMKMDPNITDNIMIEANYLVCQATELFIRHMAKEVYEMDDRGVLTYKNLAEYVQKDPKLDFLSGVIPKKITVRDYKKILAEELEKEKKLQEESGSDISSSEESSSEEESDESDEDEVADEKPKKK